MLAFVFCAEDVYLQAVCWVHYLEDAGVGELAVESATTVLGLVFSVGLLYLFDGFRFVYQILLLSLFWLVDLQRIYESIVPSDVMVILLFAEGLR